MNKTMGEEEEEPCTDIQENEETSQKHRKVEGGSKNEKMHEMEETEEMEEAAESESEGMRDETDHAVALVTSKNVGVRQSKDMVTGETSTYVAAGTQVYEETIKRYDESRLGPRRGSEAYTKERSRIAQAMISKHYIYVPATEGDQENEFIKVEEHEVVPDGPKIPSKLVPPDPNNPLHVELLWKQKGVRLYEPTMDVTTGKTTLVTTEEAMTDCKRIPYQIAPEHLMRTYGIKSPKTLAISVEAMNQALEFYAANLQEQLTESSLIPVIIPTPWLLFVYDASPKGLAQNSFTLISKYMLIYRALEAKIHHVSKASRETIELCKLASYGKLSEYEGEPPAYTQWNKEHVIKYIHGWNEASPSNKKARKKINDAFGITPKNMFKWVFFSRAVQSRTLSDAYYSSIIELIQRYAVLMEIESTTPSEEEGDSTMATRVDKYTQVVDTISSNPMFLRDLFKLHCEYMYAYVRNLEDFLLFLSFEHIPIQHWDSLTMPPLVDPTFPPGTYDREAHVAISAAMSVLEGKSLMGCIKDIREQKKLVQIQRLLRMKKIKSEEDADVQDDTDCIYGTDCLSAPTFLQMKLYCEWICFATKTVDQETERKERDKLLMENIQGRIAHADAMGRKIVLHTRDGETIETEPKRYGGKRESERK